MNVALAPAWGQFVDGTFYAVRRVGGSTYEVWREGQKVGSFEFFPHTVEGPVAYISEGPEAHAVANAFVEAYHRTTTRPDSGPQVVKSRA